VLLITSTASPGRSLEELEGALARTPPVSTGFVEYRFSHLLKKPLQTRGTLEYRADGVLARTVASPYQETTVVDGDTVRIRRGNKPERTLSLQRAPQLRVLLGSFRALLEGKLTPLASDFEITLDDRDPDWTLTLQPKDPRLSKHLARIRMHGTGDRPGCMEAVEPDGDAAITLLEDTPAAGDATPTPADLARRCHLSATLNPAPLTHR
jgi:hypothetical protein